MKNLSSNIQNRGNVMPLLMNYTSSTKIQEETNPHQYLYNDGKQIVEYDMRVVGTRSLKTSNTKKGNCNSVLDKKNEIDDQKNV
jgi:hypothetical protein